MNEAGAGAGALVGGVNSPVRSWRAVGGEPPLVARGFGSHLVDGAGREYVDLVGAWGAAILGHAHPAVVDAVGRAAAGGLAFGATTAAEEALAEEIRSSYPPAERVRLVTSGTEATMTALRIARAVTGRDVVIKFAGHYHGHVDSMLVAAGSGAATAGVPDSAGVTPAVAADTVVVPFNDLASLEAAFAANAGRVAAVICEGAAANMGVVAPAPGYLAGVATACRGAGALLILDEVLTGFRVGPRGWWGIEADAAAASGAVPWVPDLVTLGKVIGGGAPLAAVGGRADLMDWLAPAGPVYQAGTLAGSPLAVAAGLATLRAIRAEPDFYPRLAATAERLFAGVTAALTAGGVPHALGRAGTLGSVFVGLELPPPDFAAAQRQDTAAYARLFHALHDDGVWAPPSAFEAWFVSAAHSHDDVDEVAAATARWAKAWR